MGFVYTAWLHKLHHQEIYMKQNITIGQYNELSYKGRGKLYMWTKHKSFEFLSIPEFTIITIPLLSIGEMIEFLDQNHDHGFPNIEPTYDGKISLYEDPTGKYTKVELCDALWEVVKLILEK